MDGWRGRGGGNIYLKGYQYGQSIQLLSVIMLRDLRVTVCVCSEGSALFHIAGFGTERDLGHGGLQFCIAYTHIL